MRAGFARKAKLRAKPRRSRAARLVWRSRVKLGRSLSGFTPAAKACWIAGAASDDSRNEFVLAVVPTDRDVEQVTGDVRFFLGGLEGLSADELENAVLPFPSQEVDPYRGLAPHLRIASARARALHAMATGQARVVVASAAALAAAGEPAGRHPGVGARPRAGRRHRHAAARRDARGRGIHAPGPRGRPRRVLHPRRRGRHLPGRATTCRPASSSSATRLRPCAGTSPPRSDRSTTIERLKVVPLRELLGESAVRVVPFFDYLGIARRAIVVASEPEEIRARVEKQLAQISASYEQTPCERLSERTLRSRGALAPGETSAVRARPVLHPHRLARHRAPARLGVRPRGAGAGRGRRAD